jgi:hypothetical protein
MNRFQVAAIHLGLSIVVGIIILALMLGLWYPGGYFKLLGGSSLLYIIMGVDVCLGPLLTLIVFKQGKKSLKFDLSVIALLQLSALVYGTVIMFQTRPAFNVLEKDVFKVTLATQLQDKELAKAKNPEWRRLPLKGPVLVAAIEPTDHEEQQAMVTAAMSGLDWNLFPSLYVSYDSQRKVALSHAKPLSKLREVSAESAVVVDEFLKEQNSKEDNFVYLPIVMGVESMTAVLDAKNADFIDIIDVVTP